MCPSWTFLLEENLNVVYPASLNYIFQNDNLDIM